MGVIMKNPHIGSLALGAAILSSLVLAPPASAADQTVIEEWATVKAPPPPKIEAVKIDPKTTALLVMDFNKKSCVPARRARCAAILPKMHKLLTEARAHEMLVIHTTSGSTTVADISDEVKPIAGERVMSPGLDKLSTGEIPKMLKERGITTILMVGTSANGAVLYTASGAAVRKYKVIVPVDGMPADTAYQEQFTAWQLMHAPDVHGHVTLTKVDMITF
jgi:nicotinamidase-related amidase